MKRFLFACAAGALSAAAAAAQSPAPVAVPAAPIASAPVMMSGGAPAMSTMSASTAPARRGLFGRLRGGRTTSVAMSSPVMSSAPVTMPYPGTVITTPATGTTLPGTTVPTPMPMPAPGGSSVMPAVTGNPVVLAGGTVAPAPRMTLTPAGGMLVPAPGSVMPAGGVMDSNYTFSTVMPASGTVMMPGNVMVRDVTMPAPMMMPMSSTTSTGRMGLFARLRDRR